MYQVRQINDKDIPAVYEIEILMGLQVEWSKAFHKEDTFVAIDEHGQILGVVALYGAPSWYYLQKTDRLEEYCMQIKLVLREACEEAATIRKLLLEKVKKHFESYRKQYQDKKLVLQYFCMKDDQEEMQDALLCGFSTNSTILVLAYDLTKPLPQARQIKDVSIDYQACDEEGIRAYLNANEAGYDGIADSEDELRFNLQGEDTKLITAKVNGEIVSSCTYWKISEDHYATENVFTVPAYRRKGIGRETLLFTLNELKKKKVRLATISVRGNNIRAIKLYMHLGYYLCDHMIEMRV